MIPAFCHCCGADIRLDEPILLNAFSMYSEGSHLCHHNKPIGLTAGERVLCWTLMKAYPQTVRQDVILLRSGSDADYNAVEVLVSRIRTKLRKLNIPNPIENMWGHGYRWSLVPDGVQIKGSNGGGRPRGSTKKIIAA